MVLTGWRWEEDTCSSALSVSQSPETLAAKHVFFKESPGQAKPEEVIKTFALVQGLAGGKCIHTEKNKLKVGDTTND